MLYGLGNAVHRPEGKDQPWGGAVHCLVVRAVDGEAGAVEGVEQAARLGADRVDLVRLGVGMGGTPDVPQVLKQGAPQSHINDLHASADPQDRAARLIKGAEQLQLRLVPGGVRGLGALVGLSVQAGVQVAAAAQQQPGAGQVRWGAVTRNRRAARGADGTDIVGHLSIRT